MSDMNVKETVDKVAETVKEAVDKAADGVNKVAENETVKETVETAKKTVKKVADSETVKSAKKTAKKVAETETAKTAKKTAKKAADSMKETAAAAKKAAKKNYTKLALKETYIQIFGQEIRESELLEKIEEDYKAQGHRISSMKSLNLYVKPEEGACYYVINDTITGSVEL